MPKIAKLEPVDLKKVWPNEASDFTPWLAANLDRLGEALGINLEFVQREAPVGPFSLDILAKDGDADRKVVIENQLEPADHNHLGQVVTYAAGYDADVVVWVARDFRDEHRQALDWLNQRTSEETEFWGVVVRVVQIGDSAPASVFEVVSRPNTSRKIRVGRRESGQPSVSGQAYYAFWPRVLDRLRDDHHLTPRRNSTTASWIDFSSGIPGVKRNPSFSRQGARVELYLDTGDQASTKRLYDLLHDNRARLQDAMGEELTWERLNRARASRIALYLPDRTVNDPEETLQDTANWMVTKYVKLVESVIPELEKLVKEFDASTASTADSEDPPDDQEAEEYP